MYVGFLFLVQLCEFVFCMVSLEFVAIGLEYFLFVINIYILRLLYCAVYCRDFGMDLSDLYCRCELYVLV